MYSARAEVLDLENEIKCRKGNHLNINLSRTGGQDWVEGLSLSCIFSLSSTVFILSLKRQRVPGKA